MYHKNINLKVQKKYIKIRKKLDKVSFGVRKITGERRKLCINKKVNIPRKPRNLEQLWFKQQNCNICKKYREN